MAEQTLNIWRIRVVERALMANVLPISSSQRGSHVDCNFLPLLWLANANICQCWSLVNALLGHYTQLLVIKVAKRGNTRCASIAIVECQKFRLEERHFSLQHQHHAIMTIIWSDKLQQQYTSWKVFQEQHQLNAKIASKQIMCWQHHHSTSWSVNLVEHNANGLLKDISNISDCIAEYALQSVLTPHTLVQCAHNDGTTICIGGHNCNCPPTHSAC